MTKFKITATYEAEDDELDPEDNTQLSEDTHSELEENLIGDGLDNITIEPA